MTKFKVVKSWNEKHSQEYIVAAENKEDFTSYLQRNPERLNFTLTNKNFNNTLNKK